MYKGLLNTVVQPLFWLLNLLFGGVYLRRGFLQTPSVLRREEFKNTYTALFPRLGLRSRVIRQENKAFRKQFSNRRNLKTPGGLEFS